MTIIIDSTPQAIATVDMIRRSMYLINAVAAGEMPDDVDLNDALLTLNEMLDSWNIQPLAMYNTPTESWTLTPGQAAYDWGVTAGATGFTSNRPVRVNKVTCVQGGVTTSVRLVTKQEYDAIPVKATESGIIECVHYMNSYPLGQLQCYPIPTEAVVLNFDVDYQIDGPANLQSILLFPPGYLRAIRYNLAVELWPEYTNTSTDIDSVKKIAKEAFGKIKVANQRDNPTTFEDVPGVGGTGDWRIG